MLTFITAHFEALVQLFIAIIGLIMASGVIKNNLLKQAAQAAVGIAEQVRKQNPKTPAEVLKDIAMKYLKGKFPALDEKTLGDEIEGALGLINAAKKPAACPPPTIIVSPTVEETPATISTGGQ